MGFLLLGVDSLIACLAIGAIVDRRSRVPLAALFGVADGVAFVIGASIGWRISDATSAFLQTGILVAVGIYLIVVAAGVGRVAARWPVWVLPWVLTLDNFTYGLVNRSTGSLFAQAGNQALSSALLAFIGLSVAVLIPRLLPITRRPIQATQFAGGALIVAAGLELLVG